MTHQPSAVHKNWWIEFVLLAALWGSSFMFMRLGAAEFGPLPTAGLRVALATVFLWPIMLHQGHWPALRQHWRPVLFAGVTNSALPFALFAWAVLHIPTGLASILNATVPLFGALVAWVWLKDRIAPQRWLGLVLGLSGVALLTWRAPLAPNTNTREGWWAMLACLGAAVLYAISASFTRRFLKSVPPMATSAGSLLGASITLAPATLLLWPTNSPSPRAWLAIVAMAVFCTGIAYVLYFRLIANAGPSKALSVTFLTPVFALLYGIAFLNETLTLWMLGCGLLVVFGTGLSTGLVTFAQANAPAGCKSESKCNKVAKSPRNFYITPASCLGFKKLSPHAARIPAIFFYKIK
jgi:drug/metabolite transporter (DMT)-like permease